MYYQGGTLFTGPYPSSTPQLWDPKVVLGLYNIEKEAITCPGFATSKGRRCWKVPARHKVNQAKSILSGPASKPYSEAVESPELGQAATILLCIYHIDQYSDIVRQWRTSLTSLASRDDHKPAQNGMNAGGRSGIPRCEPYVNGGVRDTPQQQRYSPNPKEKEMQEEERKRRQEEERKRRHEEARRREEEQRRRSEKRAQERAFIERVLLELERAQQLEAWRPIRNLYRQRNTYSQGLSTPPVQVQ
ncbi:uncharacterized protein F4812DRAFT_460098 [Daldinia caldariorum]|uniref:uncharacterized protein n=1 Tax=Daldinia caldariorum TaxID=326644 RepID=UPI002008D5B5|nr:uncharacterized protein F4812DRAFT_460098 [Daldinia caldariorum]KAI1467250.1 hypothetical protein F4812DRAFT_460098 [Daldinia caldariorum]